MRKRYYAERNIIARKDQAGWCKIYTELKDRYSIQICNAPGAYLIYRSGKEELDGWRTQEEINLRHETVISNPHYLTIEEYLVQFPNRHLDHSFKLESV